MSQTDLRSALTASICTKPCRDDYHEGWNDALMHVLALLDAETGTGQDSAVRAEVMAIYQAFEMEALNGVICSIPDTGLDTPPHRTWCARCQRRWKRLRAAGADPGTEPAQEPKP